MYHQARTSSSELTASRNASSLRLPRVGARTRASATASAGGLRAGPPGPGTATGSSLKGSPARRPAAVRAPAPGPPSLRRGRSAAARAAARRPPRGRPAPPAGAAPAAGRCRARRPAPRSGAEPRRSSSSAITVAVDRASRDPPQRGRPLRPPPAPARNPAAPLRRSGGRRRCGRRRSDREWEGPSAAPARSTGASPPAATPTRPGGCPGVPTATSVEPPPTSTTATDSGSSAGSQEVAPRKASAASSPGLRILSPPAPIRAQARSRPLAARVPRSPAVPALISASRPRFPRDRGLALQQPGKRPGPLLGDRGEEMAALELRPQAPVR